jgi:hypothetical protein
MRTQYLNHCDISGTPLIRGNLSAFLVEFEGYEDGDHYLLDEDDNDIGKAITNGKNAQYITYLTDQAFLYHLNN